MASERYDQNLDQMDKITQNRKESEIRAVCNLRNEILQKEVSSCSRFSSSLFMMHVHCDDSMKKQIDLMVAVVMSVVMKKSNEQANGQNCCCRSGQRKEWWCV